MSERKKNDPKLKEIGNLIKRKRLALGKEYESREYFVENRSEVFFDYEDWISVRYLSNIELGKNQISLNKLIDLATALEIEPVDLFEQIVKVYQNCSDSC